MDYHEPDGPGIVKPTVFISYCHVDQEVAVKLEKALNGMGISTFLDESGIRLGASIRSGVATAIRRSSAMIVIVSPAFQKSDWVPFEVGYMMGVSAMGPPRAIIPFKQHPSVKVPMYLDDSRAVSEMEELLEYFRSPEWGRVSDTGYLRMAAEIQRVRHAFDSFWDVMGRFLPETREPEEL